AAGASGNHRTEVHAGRYGFHAATAGHSGFGCRGNCDLEGFRAGRHDPEADARNGNETAGVWSGAGVGHGPVPDCGRCGREPGSGISFRSEPRRCGLARVSKAFQREVRGSCRFVRSAWLRLHESSAGRDLPGRREPRRHPRRALRAGALQRCDGRDDLRPECEEHGAPVPGNRKRRQTDIPAVHDGPALCGSESSARRICRTADGRCHREGADDRGVWAAGGQGGRHTAPGRLPVCGDRIGGIVGQGFHRTGEPGVPAGCARGDRDRPGRGPPGGANCGENISTGNRVVFGPQADVDQCSLDLPSGNRHYDCNCSGVPDRRRTACGAEPGADSRIPGLREGNARIRFERRATREAMNEWSPNSWKTKPAAQTVAYPSPEEADRVVAQIAKLPPLVTSWEVLGLQSQLAEAARGERFLLQGGDCAESFETCDSATIANKLKVLLQMSLVLIHGSQRRVVRVGRFAGQYAKPRSEAVESRNGVTLPSYRGDLINHPEFTAEARTPDPWLMLRGYERAALTINFIRALVVGGFVNPHHLDYWNLDWVKESPMAEEYRRIARAIGDSLQFTESLAGNHPGGFHWIDFFTSHEGLHLPYEQAQTRQVPRQEGWFDLSTHFPWIGVRTSDPSGAHVEFFRGIRNPIAVKVGPSTSPAILKEIIAILHPNDEPGRLTLIHRFGADSIRRFLPRLIEAARETGKTVLWCCDPMHGNTRMTADGIKTRYFEEILGELDVAFDIHAACGSRLGGIHIEVTGENVTE